MSRGGRLGRGAAHSADGSRRLERCLERAKAADLVVRASGGVFDELVEAAVPGLASASRHVIPGA